MSLPPLFAFLGLTVTSPAPRPCFLLRSGLAPFGPRWVPRTQLAVSIHRWDEQRGRWGPPLTKRVRAPLTCCTSPKLAVVPVGPVVS